MTGASIETTLALWASSLREVKKRMRPLFEQDRTALNAGLFVDGLLGDERRKTGWMRAEAAGDPGPWRQQAVLGRDRWDADALRDLVRDYATEHLADANAVLVFSPQAPKAYALSAIARHCRSACSCWSRSAYRLSPIPAIFSISSSAAAASSADAAWIDQSHCSSPSQKRRRDRAL